MIKRVDLYIKYQIILRFIALVATEEDHLDNIALLVEVIQGIKILRTYREAINDKEYTTKWIAAVKEEIKSLITNRTQEEFILLKGANVVSTKQIFTIKIKDSRVERFKVRLITRGFS